MSEMRPILGQISTNLPRNIKITVKRANHRIKILQSLFEMCIDFRYSIETYILAIIIMDKFASGNPEIQEMHLIAVTALFIAANYPDNQIHNFQEAIKRTEIHFTEIQIREMEDRIMQYFDNKINFVFPQCYLKKELLFQNRFLNKKISKISTLSYLNGEKETANKHQINFEQELDFSDLLKGKSDLKNEIGWLENAKNSTVDLNGKTHKTKPSFSKNHQILYKNSKNFLERTDKISHFYQNNQKESKNTAPNLNMANKIPKPEACSQIFESDCKDISQYSDFNLNIMRNDSSRKFSNEDDLEKKTTLICKNKIKDTPENGFISSDYQRFLDTDSMHSFNSDRYISTQANAPHYSLFSFKHDSSNCLNSDSCSKNINESKNNEFLCNEKNSSHTEHNTHTISFPSDKMDESLCFILANLVQSTDKTEGRSIINKNYIEPFFEESSSLFHIKNYTERSGIKYKSSRGFNATKDFLFTNKSFETNFHSKNENGNLFYENCSNHMKKYINQHPQKTSKLISLKKIISCKSENKTSYEPQENYKHVQYLNKLQLKFKRDIFLLCIAHIMEKRESNMFYVYSQAEKIFLDLRSDADFQKIKFYIEKMPNFKVFWECK